MSSTFPGDRELSPVGQLGFVILGALLVIALSATASSLPARAISFVSPDPGEYGDAGSDTRLTLSNGGGTDGVTELKFPVYVKAPAHATAVTPQIQLHDFYSSKSPWSAYRMWADTNAQTACINNSDTTMTVGDMHWDGAVGLWYGVVTTKLVHKSGSGCGSELTSTETDSNALIEFKAKITSYSYDYNGMTTTKSGDAAVKSNSWIAYTSPDSGGYFATDAVSRKSGFADYSLQFATPCDVTTATKNTIHLYDLDYGNPDNNNGKITITIKDETTGSTVYGPDPPNPTSPGNAGSAMGSNADYGITMTFEPEHKYTLHIKNIYYWNVLKYTFPYNNISYANGCPDYDLIPQSSSGGSTMIMQGDTASFKHIVTNAGKTAPGDVTYHTWRFVIPQGSAVSTSYKPGADDDSCGALFAGSTQCGRVDSGDPYANVSAKNGTTSNLFTGSSVPVDTSGLTLHAGDQLCSYVAIEKPYSTWKHNGGVDPYSMQQWRVSAPACVWVGKRLTLQIWGSDLRVGSPFVNTTPSIGSQVVGEITTPRPSATYGSWSEYGIIAPGDVMNVASGSGFQRPGVVASNVQDWSKLTFANTPSLGE